MDILQQLRGLFLEALPTVTLLLLLFVFLKKHFFAPLERVLAERAARTEGARKEAEAAQSAAREKEAAYQDALRKVRTQIYAEQDEARRKVLDDRLARVRDARNRAQEKMRIAKERISSELAEARQALAKENEALAQDIVQVVLESRPPASGRPGEAR
jgi:F-type H+-transporting ATPase subunit b